MINIQNTDDNECFKWCLVRYLNPANHHPAIITKADKDFAKRRDFKDMKFPVKIRGIHKIEKKNSIGISVFSYENKEKHPIYVSQQCCEEKHVDLLLIGEGEKHYVFIKDFNTFMYDHSLHRGRKHFCCLHDFNTEEILKRHIKDCFKINGKQTIKMPEKGEYVKFKTFERKIKSPFTIYTDFESILVPEGHGNQTPNKSYTSKYKKHVTCSDGYKLVCVDDKFSKPFKSYLGEDAVLNFISSMIEESKYCSDVMKKHFNKELVMTKVRDHCHITETYRGSPRRGCNINVKLNHKIPVVFHNLKNYDSHLIIQELGKFNLKINFIPNRLEKYVSFSINNKLSFIDSFQFLSSKFFIA